MIRRSLVLMSIHCALSGCSNEVSPEGIFLFSSHARCAVVSGVLAKHISAQEYKLHFESGLENHTKMAVKIIPDPDRFRTQFEIEGKKLNDELAAQGDPQKQAEYLLAQTEKCVDVTFRHAKYIGAAQ